MQRLKVLLILVVVTCSCKQPNVSTSVFTAFTGATIIDGGGGDAIKDAVLLIERGQVVAIGSKDSIVIPDGTQIRNLSGRYIMPGIINGHGHVGETKGIVGGHYSRDNVIENLEIYARYGVTTVVSLGGDKQEAEPFRFVNDSSYNHRARLFIAGEIVNGTTGEEVVAALNRNHQLGVDIMKIRVDDNLGTSSKMREDLYRTAIITSHTLGYKLAAHMYYLSDAKKLLEAGADMLAHSIRDAPVDSTLIRLIKEKSVGYCPTLTRELSTFVYADTAAFFSDLFFSREYQSETIKPLNDPKHHQEVRMDFRAKTYRKQLPVAMSNLKKLSDAGVPIVFGTDSGVPTRFMGYFEHIEMEMMAEAGMTPMQIIVSATKTVADELDLKGLGMLQAGNQADFLVLDRDPLRDIRNTKSIAAVFIGGEQVRMKESK
ncbi:MAG: amidohydrolase family protein [Chryseolinea sp.]